MPVGVHYPRHRAAGELLGSLPQLARGRERVVAVDHERLLAEIDDRRISDGATLRPGDHGVDTGPGGDELGVLHAVRRCSAAARASWPRRRMRGFASFTISSR